MKSIILTCLLLFSTLFSNAQLNKKVYSVAPTNTNLRYSQKGLVLPALNGTISLMASTFGPSYCFGDLGVLSANKFFLNIFDVNLLNTRFMYSLGLRYIHHNNFGLKAAIHYGTFVGTDEGSKYPTRGFSFKSEVKEFTLNAEYLLLGGPYAKRLTPHTVYLYGGAGLIQSNTELKYQDVIVSAPPRAGIADIIKLTDLQPVIPIGMGYQYSLNNRFNVGVELAYHYTFSDFVDGIQTGSSNSNDALLTLSFTFAYKIFGSSYKNPCNCSR